MSVNLVSANIQLDKHIREILKEVSSGRKEFIGNAFSVSFTRWSAVGWLTVSAAQAVCAIRFYQSGQALSRIQHHHHPEESSSRLSC